MKKMYIAVLAAMVCVPAFAQQGPMQDSPAFEEQGMHEGFAPHGDKSAFQQARGEHKAQMKATEEKMEKLVVEYNKLKQGKKKEAKLAEIRAEVAVIHEKQLDFKRAQLAVFERRLEGMRQAFAKQNMPEAKAAWVDEHTAKLIAQNGDIKVLFKPEFGDKKHMGKMGPRGPKDSRNNGEFNGRGPKEGRGPVAELPVERPQER